MLCLALLTSASVVGAQCTGCPGDLNGDATVRVNELVTAVNAALGGCPVASSTACGGDCPGDRDQSGSVTVDELVTAVRAAVVGCPATPTVSITPEQTSTVTSIVSPTETVAPTATVTLTETLLPTPTTQSTAALTRTPTNGVTPAATATATDPMPPTISPTAPLTATPGLISPTATPLVATPTTTATDITPPTATVSQTPSRTATTSQVATQTSLTTATEAAAPTSTTTTTRTHTFTPTRSSTATPSFTPTRTSTLTATAVPSNTATRTPTFTATGSFTPTRSPTATPSRTATRTASATATVSPTAGACASSNFLNVAGAAGAGASYPAPSLSVSCGASTVTVQSNGIPTYQYVPLTPNGLQAKSYTFTFPRNPAVAVNPTSVPLLGNMAVAVNGIPIYAVNEGPQPVADAYGNPIAAAILDECGSHSAQQGTFHYHQLLVKCLLQSAVSSSQPWSNADPSPSTPSPIIAYAFDGFPIYGSYECTDAGCGAVQEMRSGWDATGYQAGTVGCVSSAACSNGYCTDVLINGAPTTACVPKTCTWSNNAYSAKAGSQYLDQCNGHYGPNGDYHYHATSTFPYILGCYRGAPTNNGGNLTPPGGTCAAIPTAGATPTGGAEAPTATRTSTMPGGPPPSPTRTPTMPAGPSPTRTNTRTPTSTPTATGSPVPTLTASSTTCGGMWDELTTLYSNATNVGSCTGVAGAETIIASLMDVSGILVKPLGAAQSIESCLELRCDSTYVYVATNNLGHYQYSTNNPRPSSETRYLYRIPMQRTAVGTQGSAQNAATLTGCTSAYDQYLAFPDTSTMGEPSGYCQGNGMQSTSYLYDEAGGGARTYYRKVRCLTTNGFVNSGVNIISSTESSNGSFGSPAYYYPNTSGQSYEGTSDGVPSLDLCGGHGHHHAANDRCFALDADRTPLYSYSQATSTFNFQNWLDSTCTEVSGIVGYMFDGTPVKGPCICMARDGGGNCTSIKRARSSYVYAGLGAWGDDPEEAAALGLEGTPCSSDNDCDDDHYQCAWGVFDDDGAAGGTVVARRCVMVDYAWCTNAYINRSSEDVSSTTFVYLDRCNGITSADGYAYHATGSFPYVPSCLRYEPSDSINDANLD